MSRIFIFTGRPGAGKGTQAKRLAKKLNVKFVSAGAQIRTHAARDTSMSQKMKEETEKGMLLPSWIPMYFFHEIIFNLKEDETVVLDGFGRMVFESRMISETLIWLGIPFTVINLDISNDVTKERVAIRQGTQNRQDDHAIEQRIIEFEKHTAGAIEYYKDYAVFHTIDGAQSIEAVEKDIWEKIK